MIKYGCKIKQETAIYAICCLILCIKKVAANRYFDLLLLYFLDKSKDLRSVF